MSTVEERDGSSVFYHPKNIRFGFGRIVYGSRTLSAEGAVVEEGWVLPGGSRTADHEVALQAAQQIDRMLAA